MLDLSNFFLYGYVLDENPDLDLSEFTDEDFLDCSEDTRNFSQDKNNLVKLKKLENTIADKYLSKLFINFEFLEGGTWFGVNTRSSVWHNDYQDGDKFNSNILIYLDDNNPENGNSIEVRGPGFSHKLYPKAGQLLWLNQKRVFEHKATYSSGNRRVIGLMYFIPNLV